MAIIVLISAYAVYLWFENRDLKKENAKLKKALQREPYMAQAAY